MGGWRGGGWGGGAASWTAPPADGIALNHLTLISNGENWNLIVTFNSKNNPPRHPQAWIKPGFFLQEVQELLVMVM